MDWLKDNWWIVLLVALVLVVVYYYYKQMQEPECTTTMEEWSAKVQEIENAIDADDNWKSNTETNARNNNRTYEAERRANAEYWVEYEMGICRPGSK